MSKLYLITGFLGAGKTTFLKNFIQYLSAYRLHLIINEFGKEGVDGALLREVGTALDEINNGSIFCSCRLDRFEEVLENALEGGPDIIIVEASGLSNPMNVRRILCQEEKFKGLQYMGSICLIDAKQFQKVYETAVVIKKQLAVSDMILLNKTDLATKEQLAQVREIIKRHRPDVPVHETAFGQIEAGWLDMKDGAETQEEPLLQSEDITLRKYLLRLNEGIGLAEIRKFLEMFLDDTYRVKGFVKRGEEIYFISCVGSMYQEEVFHGKAEHVDELVVLSGNGLPALKSMKKAMQWYPDVVKEWE